MIRHSVYWLSKSSEDLEDWRSEYGYALSYNTIPASDRARHMVARIFLDAIKAAWLLGELGDLRVYEEPSFEIRQVITCAKKKKVLSLLRSLYRDIFTVPNYNLINEIGDFGICTNDEKTQKGCPHSDSYSFLLSPVSEPEVMHRLPTSSTLPVELEAGSQVSLIDSESHDTPSELRSTPSTSLERSPFHSNARFIETANISTLADGLHITQLEHQSTDHKGVEHISAGLRENELSNAETRTPKAMWTGFQYNFSSKESSPPYNTTFIRTCVRIFKLDSHASSFLHLMTFRESLPLSRSEVQPSSTVLVPVYAFSVDRPESSELYLSDSGLQPSLRYTFLCKDSNGDHWPWELYGFQGALMGAYFDSHQLRLVPHVMASSGMFCPLHESLDELAMDRLAMIDGMEGFLFRIGRWSEAYEMQVFHLRKPEKLLGKEHPSTLGSMHNMALVLNRQGKYETALLGWMFRILRVKQLWILRES